MSESLALDPSSPRDEPAAKTAPRRVVAMLKAALESLVRAQGPRFENTDPMLYRFPPL